MQRLLNRQSRVFSLVGILSIGLLFTACAAEEPDDEIVEPPADSSVVEEPSNTITEPEPDDGWDGLAAEDRCRMVIEQFPEVDPNAHVDAEDFTLIEPLEDYQPDCIYETDRQAALPTQVSIYLDSDTGFMGELVDGLNTIGFEPFDQSPTLVNLQSQYAPGSIRIENWEAEALLEPYVNSYDLKGKYLVVMTANYSPDFDPDLLQPNDTGSDDSGQPDSQSDN